MSIISLSETRMFSVLSQILDSPPGKARGRLLRAKEFDPCVKHKYIPFFSKVDVDSLTAKLIREYGVNQEWINTGNGSPFTAYSNNPGDVLTHGQMAACEKVYFLLDQFHFCVLVIKMSNHFFLVYPKKWFLDSKSSNWGEFKQIVGLTENLPASSYFIAPTVLDDLFTGKMYPGRVDKFFDKWKSNWLADIKRKDDAKSSQEFKKLYGSDFFEFKKTFSKEVDSESA